MPGNTQTLLPIDTIKNDVVILKGGSLRAILQVSSINFGLKSEQEREAIVFEYQNFINSIDFPIQVFVTSRFVNIDQYSQGLQQKFVQQENELLRIQTQEYVNFIQSLVSNINLVSTDFYIVIPFSSVETRTEEGGMQDRLNSIISLGGLLGSKNKKPQQKKPNEDFERYRSGLMQRVDYVASGMHRMGLKSRLLNTKDLLIFYWNLYNNDTLQKKTTSKSIFQE